jgi:hypothetical protein
VEFYFWRHRTRSATAKTWAIEWHYFRVRASERSHEFLYKL